MTPTSSFASSVPVNRTRRITAPIPSRSNPDGSGLPDRTLCLAVDIRRLGNRRKVAPSQVEVEVEVDADREVISVSKQLLLAPQWLDIVNHDTRIRRYLGARCLPSLFRGGVFLLPIPFVAEVDTRLEEMAVQRQKLVGDFMGVYPSLVEEARGRLRGLFDPQDYPAPEVVASAFGFSWRYLALRVPDTLAAIDREMFQREREKAARAWDEAAASIQTLLRAQMVSLVDHMVERLATSEDGKPRCFKNSLVSNLSEFLKTFEARNVTDDREIEALAVRARQLLDGVDADVLRRVEDTRSSVQSGFVDLKRQLDTLVSNRPTRRIQL